MNNGTGLSGENHGIFWARRNLVAVVVAAIFVFIAMLAMASPALADSFVVTTTDDTPLADAAVCDSNCSLREAVKLANSNAVADTITFDIPDAGPHTITLTKGQIFFATTHKTTLDGTGESVTVSGNNASRVFNVRDGNLTVKRLTVSGGNVTSAASGCCDTNGGGIYVQRGNLAVIESTVSGNRAVTGGGIFSLTNLSGTLTTTIENSTISDNTATFLGGGIYNDRGRTNITSSTITQNYAPSLYQSSGGGAGVASFGDTSTETVVANSIISDNLSNCSSESECDFQHDGDVDFTSNSQTPYNSFTSQGYNIVGDSSREYDPAYGTGGTAIRAFNKTGDQTGVTDPKLGPLQDNGGPTNTHALLTGSRAIDRGSTTLAADQRGVSRPQEAADDVGAFELEIVNTAPVAGEQSVTTDEDAAITITLTATDAENNPLTYKVSTLPTGGTLYKGDATNPANQTDANKVVVNTAFTGAEVTYVPNENYNGEDSFKFNANDGTVDSSEATVSLSITAVNDAPSFTKDANQTVAEDAGAQSVSGWATAISPGPSDEESSQTVSFEATNDNNALFTSVGQPAISSNGTLTYTPAANANGSTTVTVNANDNGGTANGGVDTSPSQTFTITVSAVNDAPTVDAQSVSTAEDTSKAITLTGSSVDGDTLTYTVVSNPTHGTLSGTGANLTYTPSANYNGSDSFTFKTNDGKADSSPATVSITVSAVNDAPVAVADANSVDEDQPLTVDAPGVLDNDEDVDSSSLTAVLVDDVDSGELMLNADGSYTYTPDANFNGEDSLAYTANDGSLDSNEVTVSITVNAVNDEPVAADDSATTPEDTPVDILASDLLNNDSEGPADESNQTLSISGVSNPVHGTAVLISDGSKVTFTPEANYYGSASFDYTVCDNGSPSKCSIETATVNVTVSAVNDAPDAVNDSATTNEDTATNIDVLANDTDVERDSLSVSGFSQGTNGTVSENDDGTLKYAPNANFFGSDSFTYTVSDGNGGTATATVNVTVTPGNDPPTVTLASGGSCSTSKTSVRGTMNLSLADVDSSGVLTLSATSSNSALVPVANITFGGNGANRTVSITPAAKKSGSATITITASDGTANSTTTIQVIVGTDRKETINGTNGSDMIFGRNGDDTINAGDGNDLVCGGNAGGVISGGAGDDTLDGGNGNDVLRGDAGKDIVRGSAGNDTLTGGSEADSFEGGSGTDVATDYNAAEGDTRTNIP